MTQPPAPSLFDAGNPRLSHDIDTDLMLGKIPVPGGEKGVATIRQGNVTLTVPLTRAAAEQWAGMFTQLAQMLSGSGIAVANSPGLIAGVNGQVR